MTSDLVSSTSLINSEECDRLAMKYAKQSIQAYNVICTCEQIFDDHDLIVEELLLVQGSANFPRNFCMRIVELRSLDSLYATIREAEVLKFLGFHTNLMGMFSLFRHRQYVAFVLPDFTCVRDRLDSCLRVKNGEFSASHDAKRRSELPKQKKRDNSNHPGLFGRNSVAYLLKEVIQGLGYVHAKGFIHTQICAANVFMSNAGFVKLGGFLHSRRIGSTKWKFTGNPDCHPPEAFAPNYDGQSTVNSSFDVWSIGLLALEVITGRAWHYPQSVVEQLASGKLQHSKSLGEIDASALRNGKQVYHKDVDNFLEQTIRVCPNERIDFGSLNMHPFLSEGINVNEARSDWQAHPAKRAEIESGRSLHAEMLSSHCEASDLDISFLMNVVKSVKLAEKQRFPIVEKVPDDRLLTEFVAVASFLTIRQADEDWSRDVLDQSHTSSREYLEDYMRESGMSLDGVSQTPGESRGISLPGDNFRSAMSIRDTGLENLQRSEMIFFVGKSWSDETRQIFVALQFARWYLANLLRFSDLIRIVDEIENILKEYATSETPLDTVPGSASFVTGLRKNHLDQDSRKFNHVHIEIALRSEVMSEMKKKFDLLQHGDPVVLGPGKTMLHAAATYRHLDLSRMEFLESLMMGTQQVHGWKYHPESRFDEALEAHSQLRGLLEERRNNPSRKFTNYKDSQTSNQARVARIWGDFDRDFMFRFCKFAIPRKLAERDASLMFHGHDSTSKSVHGKSLVEQLQAQKSLARLDEIEKQLMVTRAKQEQDVIFPFKSHNDVEARRGAMEGLMKVDEDHELRLNRLESLVQQLQCGTTGLSPYLTPASNLPRS